MSWRHAKMSGFTAMEVLVGITLTLLLALGVAPLVLAMQTSGLREGDRSVAVLQGRVAVARLERDLRMATADGCPFQTGGSILHAGDRQVVFLSSCSTAETLVVVEWELVGTTLMRRWGTCPAESPGAFPHSMYVDNKTMLAGVGPESMFTYVLDGGWTTEEVAGRDLCRIGVVGLSCKGVDEDAEWSTLIEMKARVGR